MLKLLKFMYGQIFNTFTFFKAPIKDLFKILYEFVWPKKGEHLRGQEKN